VGRPGDERPQGVPGEAAHWGTTFEASYGTARTDQDRPSELGDRPGGTNSRTQDTMWQTSGAEVGYDPGGGAKRAGGGGAGPGRHVMAVGMMTQVPPGSTRGPGAPPARSEWRGDVAPPATHGPILEAVRRRSKLADPGGAGEANVGGWAQVRWNPRRFNPES
jgi:hypothetical protein